jgi:hypothetical protein
MLVPLSNPAMLTSPPKGIARPTAFTWPKKGLLPILDPMNASLSSDLKSFPNP